MTMLYMACIALRVSTCCGVFACFLFASFKTRLKSGYLKSSLLVLLYITITAGVAILFLTPIPPLAEYNALGITCWKITA